MQCIVGNGEENFWPDRSDGASFLAPGFCGLLFPKIRLVSNVKGDQFPLTRRFLSPRGSRPQVWVLREKSRLLKEEEEEEGEPNIIKTKHRNGSEPSSQAGEEQIEQNWSYFFSSSVVLELDNKKVFPPLAELRLREEKQPRRRKPILDPSSTST